MYINDPTYALMIAGLGTDTVAIQYMPTIYTSIVEGQLSHWSPILVPGAQSR